MLSCIKRPLIITNNAETIQKPHTEYIIKVHIRNLREVPYQIYMNRFDSWTSLDFVQPRSEIWEKI